MKKPMNQKTYKFPSTGKGDVEKTLSRPTNDRIERFLKLLGKDSFRDLLSVEGQLDYGVFILDLALKTDELRSMLDVCLAEGSADIDFENLDMTIADEVCQDFFEQRSKTFMSRLGK
jgi:hypothetical protein